MGNIQNLLPVIIPIVIIELTLMTVALFHLFSHPEKIRGSKVVWIIVIVMINILGLSFILFLGERNNVILGSKWP